MSKELRHRNEVERTYSRTVFNVNKVEINRLIIQAKNRNSHCSNALESHTAANTTTVAIVTIYNKREVTYNTNSIIYIASINNLIINKQCISRGD